MGIVYMFCHKNIRVPGLKKQSYGQFKDIWYGMVWLDMVWFVLKWYGTWALYRCSSMQNFEPLA